MDVQGDRHTMLHPSQLRSSEESQEQKELSIHSELEKCDDQYDCSNVKGSLKRHCEFWEYIKSNSSILQIIREGYIIPFYSTPPDSFHKNNLSALNNFDFVCEAIMELFGTGSVVQCDKKPRVVNPLTVSVEKTKKRLVLDLTFVNPYVWKEKHKFEDLRTLLQYARKDDSAFMFDFKSGYHHVDMHVNSQEYLGFAWDFRDGQGIKYFKFTVLPFGLSSAGYIFSKVLRELVRFWRDERKLEIVMYLDDGICVNRTYEEACVASQLVRNDLMTAGLIESTKKCVWQPTSKPKWLGFIIDLTDFRILIPEEKLSDIKTFLCEILDDKRKVTRRLLSQVAGKIMALKPAVGNVVHLMTRGLSRQIALGGSWDGQSQMDLEVRREIQFWFDNISNLNGKDISENYDVKNVIFSDASEKAFAGYIVNMQGYEAHGNWSAQEAVMSSTWRELKAVQLVMESFCDNIKASTIQWCTDCKNVVNIIEKGSRKQHLNDISMRIYQSCVKYNINIIMKWIPRTENERADYLSNLLDVDDWGVTEEFFQKMDILFGKHDVDRFATFYNKKCDRYNSLFWNPQMKALNAFTQDWSKDNNWIVPPVNLVLSVIKKIESMSHIRATLVVPSWRSYDFWPVLMKASLGIVKTLEYKACNVLRHYKNENCILGDKKCKSNVLVLRIIK